MMLEMGGIHLQCLTLLWPVDSPCTMELSLLAVSFSTENPQNTKTRSPIQFSYSPPGYFPEKN